MNYKAIARGVLVASGLALGGAAYAATPSAQMLADTCAGCHGTDGASQGPATPTIAGISHDYFLDTMQAFKTGDRPSTIMNRIAKGYTDEELASMAKFFSDMDFAQVEQPYEVDKAKRGFLIHDKACKKCHDDGGRSKEDDSGILAGQWTQYLEYSMRDFRTEHRIPPKKMRKGIEYVERNFGDDGFEQLLNFYASQVD